jgi:hypothetical protein
MFAKMCIKGARILSQICLKVFGNWRCFQRSISMVLRLFHEFALKCLEIESVLKDIKGANTFPRICFKMCGNWRCFQRCVLKVPRLFHEFAKKCLEI